MRSLLPFQWGRVRDANTDPFSALHQEIDRVFSDFGAGHWPSFASSTGSAMRLDVSETDDTIEIDAELPGMDEKDVEVVLNDNILTIKGEKKHEKEEKKKDYHMVERHFGSFSRSITLPYEVDPESIKATFKKGVLHISAPKPAEVKDRSHKISVQSSS